MEDILDRKVLLLNKGYNLIKIITAKEAIIKVYHEVAEVITVENGTYCNYDFNSWADISKLKAEFQELDELDDVVYSSRLILVLPRIIRLLKYNKIPSTEVHLNRRNIYLRDNNTCQYCGKKFPTDKLNLDHVIPKAQGGKDSWENLVCACFNCNQKKGGRTPKEAGMKLLKIPIKLKYNPILKVHIEDKKYEAWTNFISEAYWTTDLG